MSGTAIIIQARLGSSRLPAKVLLPLHNDNSVLTEVIYRCLSIKDIDFVIVAAPERDVEIISDHLCGFGHEIVGGPEHNVLARYYKAACRVNADTIMRITADCPMIDPNVCAGVLAMHKGMGVHYTSNIWPQRLYPPGYDCEVFSMEALAAAHYTENKTLEEMEHVTPLIRLYGIAHGYAQYVPPFEEIDKRPRTLDTIEDYRRIWNMMVEDDETYASASAG